MRAFVVAAGLAALSVPAWGQPPAYLNPLNPGFGNAADDVTRRTVDAEWPEIARRAKAEEEVEAERQRAADAMVAQAERDAALEAMRNRQEEMQLDAERAREDMQRALEEQQRQINEMKAQIEDNGDW